MPQDDSEETRLVTYVHEYFLRNKEFPKKFPSYKGIPAALQTEKAIRKLQARGLYEAVALYSPKPDFKLNALEAVKELVPEFPDPNNAAPPVGSLSPDELLVALAVLNTHDRRALKMKLQELEVTTVQFNSMMAKPHVVNFIADQSKRLLQESGYVADLALKKNMDDGNLEAIKYYNGIFGRYGTSGSTFSMQDLTIILHQVLNILSKYVQPEALSKVADELAMIEVPERSKAS